MSNYDCTLNFSDGCLTAEQNRVITRLWLSDDFDGLESYLRKLGYVPTWHGNSLHISKDTD